MAEQRRNRFGKLIILGIIGIVVLLLVGRNFLLQHDPSMGIRYPEQFPAPIDTTSVTVQGATLGRLLFNDPILSRHQETACASCHQQAAAYADLQQPLSTGDAGQETVRNSPALMNLIWKKKFFADGRATRISETVYNAIIDKRELNSDMRLILARLNAHPIYLEKFQRLNNTEKITTDNVLDVLSQYLRTLNSSNSKYDAFVQNKALFTTEEAQGWKLFQANCQSCHVPPLFDMPQAHNVNSGLGNDLGAYLFTNQDRDKHAFYAGSLRNIIYSAPYFHDGRFATLDDLLAFHTQVENTNQLQHSLSRQEQKAVISFLNSLSDSQFISSQSY